MSMRFLVPTNWQEDLIPGLIPEKVAALYGQMAADAVGGGRSAYSIRHVSRRAVARHVAATRRAGMDFTYLLNTTCLGNREWTRRGQRQIRLLLDWLSEIGVNRITVSIPLLLQIIKREYPHFRVAVSTMAHVRSPNLARRWETLGADEITLPETELNRNFPLLESMVRAVSIPLVPIVNLDCLPNCIYQSYHGNSISHGSQQDDRSSGTFLVNYCYTSCRLLKVREPAYFVRSAWIRPEDLSHYTSLGIKTFKLVERGMSTQRTLNIFRAYVEGRYEGNLLDLLPRPWENLAFQPGNFWHQYHFFFQPWRYDIPTLLRYRDVFKFLSAQLDNRELDGFLDGLKARGCGGDDCAGCGYCDEVAARAVKLDAENVRQYRKLLEEYLDKILSGAMFHHKTSPRPAAPVPPELQDRLYSNEAGRV